MFSRTIDGIAADGSFVYIERIASGRVVETVSVADARGKRIAWCDLGEADDGTHDTWSCHGDRRFRASGTTRSDRVARAWSRTLGPMTPLAEMNAPAGITHAICARTPPVRTGAGQIDCSPDTATPFANASSPLVFLRFHVKPFAFCGGTSTHDEMTWVPRDQLATRLARRGALFAARERWPLAIAALEALVWLDPTSQAATELERVRARSAR